MEIQNQLLENTPLPTDLINIIAGLAEPNKFKAGCYYSSWAGRGYYKIIKRTSKFVSVIYTVRKCDTAPPEMCLTKKKILIDENENEYIKMDASPLSRVWSYNLE